MALPLRKLDGYLQAAVDAEIAGEPADAVSRAESRAQAILDVEIREMLQGFGRGEAVAKREYSLQELRENGIDPARLLSPEDLTLENVRRGCIAFLSVGGAAVILAVHPSLADVFRVLVAGSIAAVVDIFVNQGAMELAIVDALARLTNQDYQKRVAQHEAGHFLVAYLVGVLPKAYTLSTWDALTRYRSSNVQAGCVFCDGDFQQEVQRGALSSSSLDKFVCVALAGVAVEYLLFGQARGGVSDIQQVERLLQALSFEQRKADAIVRWAVMNTVGLLRRHAGTHKALAEAMERGAPVGECILLIERCLSEQKAPVAS